MTVNAVDMVRETWTLPLAGLVLLILALFAVTGMFSSQVTKAPGNETLIGSPTYNFLILKNPNPTMSQPAYNSRDLSDTIPVAAYQRAYYDNTENSLQCGRLYSNILHSTSNQNPPCLFSQDVQFRRLDCTRNAD